MVQKRKETMISVRLEGQDAEVLNSMADHLALSRSELIRNATSSYITMSVENPAYPNPKIFFSRNLMCILFEDLPENTIRKVAYQSFLNGIRDYIFLRLLTDTPLEQITPEDAIHSVVENVFSHNGQGWFERAHFSTAKNTINIAGSHDMGANFSLFVKFLMEHYLDQIGYIMKSEEMRTVHQPFDRYFLKLVYIVDSNSSSTQANIFDEIKQTTINQIKEKERLLKQKALSTN